MSLLDEVAARIGRSKSWIVRQALAEWLTEKQRKYEFALQILNDIDEGRMLSHKEVLAMLEQRRREPGEA